jgi:hypothetical protein
MLKKEEKKITAGGGHFLAEFMPLVMSLPG